MRILLLTQLFNPEPNHLKGITFATELHKLGHEVEVLANFPNYPGGRLYAGYRQSAWHREMMGPIPVTRVPVYPSHDRSAIRRVLSYGSFALSSGTVGAALVRGADVVHVYQGPPTLAFPAMVLKWLRGMPFVYDIQDLWPESVSASGMMDNAQLLKVVEAWCQLAYDQASRIVVLSPGFKSTLIDRGVPAEKIDVVMNWCEEAHIQPGPLNEALRRELGLADRFVVLFAGGLGTVQGLDTVLDAAARLRDSAPRTVVAFMGSGVERDRLEARGAEMGLGNVRFLPRQPIEAVGEFLAAADALLIHLRDDPIFRVTIPQKTQAYLAAGRPIVIGVAGDAARLVTAAGAGIACAPGDAGGLAEAIAQLEALSPEARARMGEAGRAFYLRELSLAVGVRRFETIFSEVARSGRKNSGTRRRVNAPGAP